MKEKGNVVRLFSFFLTFKQPKGGSVVHEMDGEDKATLRSFVAFCPTLK
ncbi:hypothetical protein [Priestia endophytica]|nr:hypothetical protein [Priestia endophytica]